MRQLYHYPTLSHSFLRNATKLFGFYINYRFIAVHSSQRKKKRLSFTTKKTAAFHNEKKTATFHNGAVLSENTN